MSPWALARCRQFKILNSQKKQLLSFSTTTATTTTTTSENEKPSGPAPPPIRVTLTESAGRGVFATRRIGAGDLIHTAKPIISHPSLWSINNTVCYFCLKKISTLTDIKPQNASFCSQDCKDKSKKVCSTLRAVAHMALTVPPVHLIGSLVFYDVEKKADWLTFDDYCRIQGMKYPLLVKRLACMVISGAASADSLDILQPASLSPEMILQMEEGFGLLSSAFTKANITSEHMAFLTKQWYTGVLARIRINAFRIELAGGSYEDLLSLAAASVEAEAAVGTAVYMLPSFYNHDCDPNAHIIWIENADARLKALRDIEEGEELRICYIDASMGHEARQTLLSQGFGFQCNCLRCLSGD